MSLYGRWFTGFQIRDQMVMVLTLVRKGKGLVSNVTDYAPRHRLIGLEYRFCSLGMLRLL